MGASDCSALLHLMLIKSFYKLLLVYQTLLAPHFFDAEFLKLRPIDKLSPPCIRNPGGGGSTGRF